MVGGVTNSPTGQTWGSDSSTVGFGSGNGGQGVVQGGNFIGASFIGIAGSTLTATRKATVTTPEPGTILGLVAVGAGLVASKRKKQG